MRVLALDYGAARCGAAISDPTGTIASPLEVIERPDTRRAFKQLRELVKAQQIERVVVGLPVGLSGHETEQTTQTRRFAERLQNELGECLPVDLYDERLTTKLAARSAHEQLHGAARSAPIAAEDSRAAAHLLETWLQAQGG